MRLRSPGVPGSNSEPGLQLSEHEFGTERVFRRGRLPRRPAASSCAHHRFSSSRLGCVLQACRVQIRNPAYNRASTRFDRRSVIPKNHPHPRPLRLRILPQNGEGLNQPFRDRCNSLLKPNRVGDEGGEHWQSGEKAAPDFQPDVPRFIYGNACLPIAFLRRIE